MQTCPASMPYDNQRIRDVVDDAVELDVATKMVVGLGWERRSQLSRLPDTGDPRSKPRLSPQPTRVCARHHCWCCLQLRYSVIDLGGSWRWGVLVGRWSFSSAGRSAVVHTAGYIQFRTVHRPHEERLGLGLGLGLGLDLHLQLGFR